MAVIAVLSTLDTKGQETGFIADCIRERGHSPLIIDVGILGEPTINPDIRRMDVAAAAGENLNSLIAAGDKGSCIEAMIKGAAKLAISLYKDKKIDGLLAIGGAQGTAIGTAAMRELPLGVPKVMVSAVANGDTRFGPYVGTKDIIMMHSVADILGVNFVTRKIFSNAVGAMVGMVETVGGETGEKQAFTIAITMAGVTTPCVMEVKGLLEKMGYDVITFHCNGIGSRAIDEFVSQGQIKGVIDLAPHDVTGYLCNGLMKGDEKRFSAVYKKNLPILVAPGCADIILRGPKNTLELKYQDRKHVVHNPFFTHVLASREELFIVGSYLAKRLQESKGPRGIIIPLRGFSQLNKQGGPLYEPETNLGFLEGVRDTISEGISLLELDMHINDEAFARSVATEFHKMIQQSILH